ncbi:MAG: D-amino acid aminotransferase [Legionellales bacterium]|nr:D-amino acid aminotransferase [Legionellales bacterium]
MKDTQFYFNGQFLPATTACISPFDRGFLFGDAVYEVIPVYEQQAFKLKEHFERFKQSLSKINLTLPLTFDNMLQITQQLIHQPHSFEAISIYWHISRGSNFKRTHAPSHEMSPTCFACIQPRIPHTLESYQKGFKAILHADIRWALNEIKSTAMLANVLLSHQAQANDAQETLLHHDGYLVEGASSNLFYMLNGVLRTPPKQPRMLSGITRDYVISVAQHLGLLVNEEPCPIEDLEHCDELYITSSTREIMPITQLGHHPIGSGRVGPNWRGLFQGFQNHLNTCMPS